MAIVLGFQPEKLTVRLTRFGDYVAALIYDDGDPLTVNAWPVGTVIQLRFYPTETTTMAGATWPATIVADRAEWHIDNAVVASAVLNPGNDFARLFYDDGAGTELEWALGSVKDVN